MKKVVFTFCMFMLIFSAEIFSQIDTVIDVSEETLGSFPRSEDNSLIRGGKEKTASGILRVLVIYVRYLDDVSTTDAWPNYHTLPNWTQTIVDPNIPPLIQLKK